MENVGSSTRRVAFGNAIELLAQLGDADLKCDSGVNLSAAQGF